MRKLSWLGLFWLCAWLAMAGTNISLREKLDTLQGISDIESLSTEYYPEKYVMKFEQYLNPKDTAIGRFHQRIVVCHQGFERPTVIVTEGYGGKYALSPRYHEELSALLQANVVFVEHRYFLESAPTPKNWDYLTAENSAYDLHRVVQTFKQIYPEKWISTGISKGGQTTMLYRAFFPYDVDFSVAYVAPLCRSVEDGRHEPFFRKVGTRKERRKIEAFQREVLQRRNELRPLFQAYVQEKGYTFRTTLDEIYDLSVLEYPFALWQWGTSVSLIPEEGADAKKVFDHWMQISDPSYFSVGQDTEPFNVQAARELGYYGYDTAPFKKWLTIPTAKGYLNRVMLPDELRDKVEFRPELYHKIYGFLRDNDPKIIFIYGEIDPWTAVRVPTFTGKQNEQIYIQPHGSHLSRIGNMPEKIKQRILEQIHNWLEE